MNETTDRASRVALPLALGAAAGVMATGLALALVARGMAKG